MAPNSPSGKNQPTSPRSFARCVATQVEIEIIHTTGDKITDVPLAMVGTKGMFTKEIEEALAAGRVDLAVHSLKDLPTELPSGFEIAAITERQDPRDAFCSRSFSSFQDLPQGARVGTSSLRRQAQLKAIRPDLDIHPLRGNVDTRLRKLEQGEYDAIILASAGLKRLGKTELIKQIIPAEIMCPAAGQGALGIEIRKGDAATRQHLEFLNDPAARAATTCERAHAQPPRWRLPGSHRRFRGNSSIGQPSSGIGERSGRARLSGRASVPLEKETALTVGGCISKLSSPTLMAPNSCANPATETILNDSETKSETFCSAAAATKSSKPSMAAVSPFRPNHESRMKSGSVLLQLLGGTKSSHALRRWINFWPPFLGAGIRVKHIAPDMKAVDVEMKLRWWNANYVGTHFGGSLFCHDRRFLYAHADGESRP